MFKRQYAVGAVVAVSMLATACSGGTGSGGSGGTASPSATNAGGNTAGGQEQVELRVMWWGDQKRADITNEVLQLFMDKNPNIKVIGEFAPSSGYFGTYNFTFEGMDIAYKQNGAQLYDMAAGKLGFEESNALDWFGYWAKTTEGGGVVTPELAVSHPIDDPSKSLITSGKAAMNLIPSNQLGAYQGLTEDPLTMVQLPRGPKGTGVVFESSQGLSGYAKTEHPKEVAMLISFFINDSEAAKILGNNRGVPVTSKNRSLLEAEASDVDKIVYDYTSRVSEATKTEPFAVSYNPPGNAEFEKMGKTTVQEIGFGRKTVEQAVKDFYGNAVKIFNSNQ